MSDDDEYGHPQRLLDSTKLRCGRPLHFVDPLDTFASFLRARVFLQDVGRQTDFYGVLFFITNKAESRRDNEYVRSIEYNEAPSAVRNIWRSSDAASARSQRPGITRGSSLHITEL